MSIGRFTVNAASHFAAGYQIGKHFKSSYENTFQTAPFKVLKSFYETAEGKTFVDRCVSASEKCYPGIMQEIRGYSEGSGLPLENFLLHSISSEIWLVYRPQTFSAQGASDTGQRCTDVQVNTPECRMIAHNEDWIKEYAGKCFVVDVTINKNEIAQEFDESTKKVDDVMTSLTEIQRTIFQRNERFISYVTPGDLPGFNFAMNKHFVITINSQLPVQTNTGAVPVEVLLRALLACETIDECVAVMKNEPVGCCYGINVNIASIHTDDMWSLEDGSSVLLSALPMQPAGSPHYVHANHYKYTQGVKEQNYPHSIDRARVAQSLVPPTDMAGICDILGDTSHPEHPIYREPTQMRSATLATAVFDLYRKEMHVFNANPKTNKPLFVVPFLT
ncbi:uncharacterized protein LOC127860278 isoform X2 [Dreissena polymorpha]|uniref:uncharacterized protein LOC127860278 isoform X2 n=1 Tax=Dreissena polymorpha TaxID=45954 RepID=UPI00226422CB|nr:uncharacterized protein LOC127860278 isoform X2 [Dreissena polymorpha]